MAFWVVRAGKHGVNEDYSVDNCAVVIGWESVGDLSAISSKEAMLAHVQTSYPDAAAGSQRVWAGELWAFKERIQINEWVAVPLTSRAAIAVGRIVGPYRYVADAPTGAKHQRSVDGFEPIFRVLKSIKIFSILSARL